MDSYHLPTCELIIVLIEKLLYQINQYNVQQLNLERDEKNIASPSSPSSKGQCSPMRKRKKEKHCDVLLKDPMGEDNCFSNPLLYLCLQLIKGSAKCRDLFVQRKIYLLIIQIANSNIHNIIVVRTCTCILLHLHDPNSISDVSIWLKPSKIDDIHTHIYVTLCLWRILLLHPEARDVYRVMKGIELPIRRLSKIINLIKRTGRSNVNVETNTILITLLKGLLGLIWISFYSTCNTDTIDLFVQSSGVNLIGSLLRWKKGLCGVFSFCLYVSLKTLY